MTPHQICNYNRARLLRYRRLDELIFPIEIVYLRRIGLASVSAPLSLSSLYRSLRIS